MTTDYQAVILVVDDTPANLSLLVGVLTKGGYRVRAAKDGPSALASLDNALPDLVLLDIMMPGMDGYAVCEQLKANDATRDIPVIFLSALSASENIVQAFDVGGVDYITKPFNVREVMRRVENQLSLVRQRREIEALRHQERQQFERIRQLREVFIQGATHDLKNPLAVINGYAYLMAEHECFRANPDLGHQMKIVQRNVEKARLLVQDMLSLLEVESRANFYLDRVEVASFISGVLENLALLAEKKQHTLEWIVSAETIGYFDPHRMMRVLDNLVSNAIKYTPDGGRIVVEAWNAEGWLWIEVRDNGMGIAAEDLPQLFTPFYRVQDGRQENIEGTGIGLAVVQAIVAQHHGEITVSSEVDRGTTFRIALPL